MEKQEWKRPQDVETFKTSDPNEMLGKYITKDVLKTWKEDFLDEETKEVISIERCQVISTPGKIDSNKLQELEFALQSKDITEVEISEENVQEIEVDRRDYYRLYMVKFYHRGITEKYLVRAFSVPQAIQIATEFGQMYRGVSGWVYIEYVILMTIGVVTDDDACIPEEERTPAYEDKTYFKVQIRSEWEDDEGAEKKSTENVLIAADEVGQAKERVARYIDMKKAEAEKDGCPWRENMKKTIRKAAPFTVDCIVPKEYSQLYFDEQTK